VKYTMTTPCDQCPFLDSAQMRRGFTMHRLREFASGEFPCHKSADDVSGEYRATEDSVHCAGALIFNEKRERPHQMMRICERLGFYDMTKLNMNAPVR
jgi:hypothetical protein